MKTSSLFILVLLSAPSFGSQRWLSLAFESTKDKYTFAIHNSGYIFTGKVIRTKATTVREESSGELLLEVESEFETEESLKGNVESHPTLFGNKFGDCGCRYHFEPGIKYLVFANKTEGKLVSYFCELVFPTKHGIIQEIKDRLNR